MKIKFFLFSLIINITGVFSQTNTTNTGTNSGTTGNNNSFFGANAGRNTTSNTNTFIGESSGETNTTGVSNTFVGRNAGLFNQTGNNNIFMGVNAGRENIAGNRNVYIGLSSGRNAVGNANVFIGYQAGFDEAGSNKLIFNNSNARTPLVYGDFNTGQLGINTNVLSEGNALTVNGDSDFNGELSAFNGAYIGTNPEFGNDDVTFNGHLLGLGVNGYNFKWYREVGDDEAGVYHSIRDNITSTGQVRHFAYFERTGTAVVYNDRLGGTIFRLDSYEDSTPVLSLPNEDTRLVIGADKTYETGRKLVVKDGSALIEGSLKVDSLVIKSGDEDQGDARISKAGSELEINSAFMDIKASEKLVLDSSEVEILSTEDLKLQGVNIRGGLDVTMVDEDDIIKFNGAANISMVTNEIISLTGDSGVNIEALSGMNLNSSEGDISISSSEKLRFQSSIQEFSSGEFDISGGVYTVGVDEMNLTSDELRLNGENTDVYSSNDLQLRSSEHIRMNCNAVNINSTASNEYMFSVGGKGIMEEVKVALQGTDAWPDYVFEKSYQLPTLKEVEKHINKKGHLANIPSAKEVKKEGGIHLGEMNVKLLQKIEELTLYTIQQEKMLEKLMKRLEALEKASK